MSHIVVYQAGDGSSDYEPCDSLEAAIVVAERMRNSDGVETPRIFKMEEVEFDFRPYYRIEVADEMGTMMVTDAPVQEAVVVEAEPTDAWETKAADSPDFTEPEPLVYTLPDEYEAPSEPEQETHFAEPTVDVHDHTDADTDAGNDADADSVEGSNPFDTLEVPSADSEMPAPPESEADAPSDGEADPMISVRRGLFGR